MEHQFAHRRSVLSFDPDTLVGETRSFPECLRPHPVHRRYRVLFGQIRYDVPQVFGVLCCPCEKCFIPVIRRQVVCQKIIHIHGFGPCAFRKVSPACLLFYVFSITDIVIPPQIWISGHMTGCKQNRLICAQSRD